MGANTGIAWTDYTFNPWIGCSRVSPACTHCYAATLASTRMKLDVWDGKERKPRHITAPSTWKQPLAWNRKAIRDGVRYRVFCASMADVFEEHPDVAKARIHLWRLIEETTNLDWLLLTKRPENVRRMVPQAWLEESVTIERTTGWPANWPAHVWVGTSVENQMMANKRIPTLCTIPAQIRFLSCEPLLGMIDLDKALDGAGAGIGDGQIDWVICGAESGLHYRPMNLDWARSLRDQCQAANVPFFFKQSSGLLPGHDALLDGELIQEFPAELHPPTRTPVEHVSRHIEASSPAVAK